MTYEVKERVIVDHPTVPGAKVVAALPGDQISEYQARAYGLLDTPAEDGKADDAKADDGGKDGKAEDDEPAKASDEGEIVTAEKRRAPRARSRPASRKD